MGRRTTVNSIREMVTFEVGKEIEKDVFRLITSEGQRKKFRVPVRNRTSEVRIPRTYALLPSNRDSKVSEAYNEVHMTRVLHTAWISICR